MVGMSAHVVCMVEFTVNAHDVYVTTKLLRRPTSVCTASWGMGEVSLRAPRYSACVSYLFLFLENALLETW